MVSFKVYYRAAAELYYSWLSRKSPAPPWMRSLNVQNNIVNSGSKRRLSVSEGSEQARRGEQSETFYREHQNHLF